MTYDSNKVLFQLKNVYKNDEKINAINISKKDEVKDENNNILKIRRKSEVIIKGRNLNLNEINIIDNHHKDNENASKNILNKKINTIEEEINIIKLKNQKDNLFYLTMLIENITYEKRKKYLSNNEINNLPYKYALLIDNRNKGEYYWSLLKEKNKIISMFLNNEDYNISTVKICLFILTFNLSFTINALFYNDEAIYQINQNNGSYSSTNQITRIIYSSIISIAIGFIAEYFALTSRNIIELRINKTYEEAKNFSKKIIKKIKLKCIVFGIITIILNLIFMYYITAFCSVYFIIQIFMITDSLMSFLLSISYTLLLTLIPPLFRNISLKKNNKCNHFLYLLSWIIALI